MSLVTAAAWTLGVLLVRAILVSLTDSARPGANSDLVNLTACAVLAYSVLSFGALRVHSPHASVRDVLAVRWTSPLGVLLAGIAGAGLAPGMALLEDFLLKRFPLSPEETELNDKVLQASSVGERVVLAAAVLVVFPVCEEIFFRGVIFRGVRRATPEGLAVVSCAVLYALGDLTAGGVVGFPTALILGLLTAWLRGRSGSLVPPLVAHVAYGAVSAVPIALGKTDLDVGPKLALGGVIGAGICAWGVATLFSRDARAERGRQLDDRAPRFTPAT